MDKLRVLITGGAGFIGANVAARHIGRGNYVTILDNLYRRGSKRNLEWLRKQGEFDFIKLDIKDDAVLNMLTSKVGADPFDVVYHLAAQVTVTNSIVDPIYDFDVNARGTILLLEAIHARGKQNPIFIFASTNKVYGNLE